MNDGYRITWLSPSDAPDAFPDIELAVHEPEGLLAAGGDLGSTRLLAAYRRGIFPWYEEGQPILWWSPNPRCVIRPGCLHVAKRLQRELRHSTAEYSFDGDFSTVVNACAEPRESGQGTWITRDMAAAYRRLHDEGWAHSVEIWQGDRLIGGMYGIAIGCVFFGESMFSRESNASKFALLALTRWLFAHDFVILDCQVVSQHLLSLGAVTMPRREFAELLRSECVPARRFLTWPSGRLDVRELATP